MGTQQRTTSDLSGIPELAPEPPRHDSDISEAMEEMGKGIVNAFTIERETSLADGAGAPGSTDVGGLARDDEPSPPNGER